MVTDPVAATSTYAAITYVGAPRPPDIENFLADLGRELHNVFPIKVLEAVLNRRGATVSGSGERYTSSRWKRAHGQTHPECG